MNRYFITCPDFAYASLVITTKHEWPRRHPMTSGCEFVTKEAILPPTLYSGPFYVDSFLGAREMEALYICVLHGCKPTIRSTQDALDNALLPLYRGTIIRRPDGFGHTIYDLKRGGLHDNWQ